MEMDDGSVTTGSRVMTSRAIAIHAVLMIAACWFLIPKGVFNHQGYHKQLQAAGTLCMVVAVLSVLSTEGFMMDTTHTLGGWMILLWVLFQSCGGILSKFKVSGRVTFLHRKSGKILVFVLIYFCYYGVLVGTSTFVAADRSGAEALGHTIPATAFYIWAALLLVSDDKNDPLTLARKEGKLAIIGGGTYMLGDMFLLPASREIRGESGGPNGQWADWGGHEFQAHNCLNFMIVCLGFLSLTLANKGIISNAPMAVAALCYGLAMMMHGQHSAFATTLHQAHAVGALIIAVLRYKADLTACALATILTSTIFLFAQPGLVWWAAGIGAMAPSWLLLIVGFTALLTAFHWRGDGPDGSDRSNGAHYNSVAVAADAEDAAEDIPTADLPKIAVFEIEDADMGPAGLA